MQDFVLTFYPFEYQYDIENLSDLVKHLIIHAE